MKTPDRENHWYEGMDCSAEWVRHPDVLQYQILLNQWEQAYQDFQKHPTPDNRERFIKIDTWVKTITLYIREINSQIE